MKEEAGINPEKEEEEEFLLDEEIEEEEGEGFLEF
jgi:hypothetical protein